MSLGPIIRIAYRVAGARRQSQVVVWGDGRITGSNGTTELGVVVRGSEEVRRITVRPLVPVIIDEVVATLSIELDDADAIYLNGYNSWTISVEKPVMGRTWGLSRAPRDVVSTYVLDGSGDYRFVEIDARKGHQHGFGYGYVRQGDEVLLFGSLNEDSGLTLIQEDAEAGTITLRKEPPARMLAVGMEREVFCMAITGGKLEDAVDRWLELAGVRAMPARPLVGYCSWYRHYGNIDTLKLLHDLEGTTRVLCKIDLSWADPVFQIDDGFAKVGDWLDYDLQKFPGGPAALAQEAAARGMIAGLWLAPFVCERDSKLYAQHPEWLLRNKRGGFVRAGSNWSGSFALDVRNGEVRDYVAKVLQTVTQEWGFKLLKLDFLYAACMEPHDGLNRGELMADAINLLRTSVPEETRLLLCGVPLVSAFGKCEYCRVGQDVGLDWDDKPHMRLLHEERVSTKLSLANARGRAHLDGKAFRCDPDVLILREDGVSLSKAQREEMLDTDTSTGGVLLTSDDMGSWNEEQLTRYHEAISRFRAHNNA